MVASVSSGHRLQRELPSAAGAGRHGLPTPGGRVRGAVGLAAAIVASKDGPEDFRGVLRDYPREIAALRDMAERNLALADDEADFV